jgi:hypothetical protein
MGGEARPDEGNLASIASWRTRASVSARARDSVRHKGSRLAGPARTASTTLSASASISDDGQSSDLRERCPDFDIATVLARQTIAPRAAVRSHPARGSIISVRAWRTTGIDNATRGELGPARFDGEVNRRDYLGVRLHAEEAVPLCYLRGLIDLQNCPRWHDQINHRQAPL